MNLGDYPPDAIIIYRFPSRDSTGEPAALVGGDIAYRIGSNVQEFTNGLSFNASDGGTDGVNLVIVNLNTSLCAVGDHVDLLLTAGTVDGINVAGALIGHFTVGVIDVLRRSVPGDYDVGTAGHKIGLIGTVPGQVLSVWSANSTTMTLRKGEARTVANGGAITIHIASTILLTAEITKLAVGYLAQSTGLFVVEATTVTGDVNVGFDATFELTPTETDQLIVGRNQLGYDIFGDFLSGPLSFRDGAVVVKPDWNP